MEKERVLLEMAHAMEAVMSAAASADAEVEQDLQADERRMAQLRPSFVLQGEGDAADIRIPLPARDSPYVVRFGRAPGDGNDVTLRNFRSVSAQHARVVVNGGGLHDDGYHVTVRDTGTDGNGSRFGRFTLASIFAEIPPPPPAGL